MVAIPRQCPSCGAAQLKRHGSYLRTVATAESGDVKIPIARVRCRGCGCTHGLLYDFLVPYRKFTLFALKASCTAYLQSGRSYLETIDDPLVEVATVFTALESMLLNLPSVAMVVAALLLRTGQGVSEYARPAACANRQKCRKPGKGARLDWALRMLEVVPDLFERASEAGISLLAGKRGCALLRTHSPECTLF